MKTINAYELINRQENGLPTIIIDAREESEQYVFEFINVREELPLAGNVFVAKRCMPSELSKIGAKIQHWCENTEGAIVVVTCTRHIKYCERIGLIVTPFTNVGVDARGLTPSVYEWFNANFQRKITKAAL